MQAFDPTALEPLLSRLKLATVRRELPAIVAQAEAEQWPYGLFLERLLAEEVAHRTDTRIARLTAKARFPFLGTIETFDIAFRPQLRRQVLGRFLGPELVAGNRSLIVEGRPGTGKTHLCIAIAYRAIQNGYTALFTTATALIDDLRVAAAEHRLKAAVEAYLEPDVLVCDEIGYLGYGEGAADVLFQVVDRRYLKGRPILFTTNKALSQWGRVLHDDDLAAAILDRTLHHGEHMRLQGASYRLRGKQLALADTAETGDQASPQPEVTMT